jgi:hypothetical protein
LIYIFQNKLLSKNEDKKDVEFMNELIKQAKAFFLLASGMCLILTVCKTIKKK